MGKVRVFSEKVLSARCHSARFGARLALVGALALGCSAFDNSATPSHALGSVGGTQEQGGSPSNGGSSTSANGGGGGSAGASTQASGSSGSAGGSGDSGGSSNGATSNGGTNNGGASGGTSSAGANSGGANAGSAGSSNGSCSDHPLTPESMWIATASSSGGTDVPAQAIDGNADTRWTSGKDQAGDEWFQLDFGKDVTIKTVTLRLGKNTGDYPRTYQTRLTDTANNTSATPQVTGSGMDSVDTVMTFSSPTTGRYLLITQGGTTTGIWWSIAEFAIACGG